MGCSKCGGGGGRTTIVKAKPPTAMTKGDNPILLEYIGTQPQMRHLNSRVRPGEKYRFGAGRKEIYVNPGDVDWMVNLNQFRVKETPIADQHGLEPVQVEYTPPPPQERLLEDTKLDVDILKHLKRAGYETVEQVNLASDAALLAIKYIGQQRLDIIRKELSDV